MRGELSVMGNDVKTTKSTRERGEDVAAEFLAKQGFKILHRNWRCSYGEFEIVAKDGYELVFVIVNVRQHIFKGSTNPAGSFYEKKAVKYQKMIAAYKDKHEAQGRPARVDAVWVVVDKSQGKAKLFYEQNVY